MIVFSHDNFVPNLKLIVMKKIIFFLSALLLPFFAFEMSADEEPAVMKIPLEILPGNNLTRNFAEENLECYYCDDMSTITTTFFDDLGIVHLTITNTATGEVWYDTLDSGVQSHAVTPISGTPGYYQVIYQIESGNMYYGYFIL